MEILCVCVAVGKTYPQPHPQNMYPFQNMTEMPSEEKVMPLAIAAFSVKSTLKTLQFKVTLVRQSS